MRFLLCRLPISNLSSAELLGCMYMYIIYLATEVYILKVYHTLIEYSYSYSLLNMQTWLYH